MEISYSRLTVLGILLILGLCVVAGSGSFGCIGGILPREVRAIDMGSVPQDSVLRPTFRVRNNTSNPYTILSTQSSCGCTTLEGLAGTVVKPGELIEIPVTVNLAGKSGVVKSEVLIRTDGIESSIFLNLRAEVSREYPHEVDLGDVLRGSEPTAEVLLRPSPKQSKLEVLSVRADSRILDVDWPRNVALEEVPVTIKLLKDLPSKFYAFPIYFNTTDKYSPVKKTFIKANVLGNWVVEPEEINLATMVSKSTGQTPRVRVWSPYGLKVQNVSCEVSNAELVEVIPVVDDAGNGHVYEIKPNAAQATRVKKQGYYRVEVWFRALVGEEPEACRAEVYGYVG